LVAFEEAISERASAPWSSRIDSSPSTTREYASSHEASRNSPFSSRTSGLVSRSSELTKSYPNLPLTQVEIPLTGASSSAVGRAARISSPSE